MPKLYRKRFIPDEIVELKDDRIVYHEGNIMITEWDVLHPKAKFSHGISCYYMDKGWKISKFLNKKKELVYYYCDIIETAYLKAENAYIFTDLLADVIIHPDGAVEVVDLGELSSQLTEVHHSKGYKIRIVPGICVRDKDNWNVIRGEETQLAGAFKLSPSKVYIMPGTHCKWVLADGSRVNSFRTAMTGEMHSIMMKYSLVGLGAGEQEDSEPDFMAGLERGYTENNIVPRLFEIRGANILGGIKPCHVGEFLSGLLIGAEVASMQKIFKFTKEDSPLTVIANDFFYARYEKALKLAGLEAKQLDADTCFLEGIIPLAQSLL